MRTQRLLALSAVIASTTANHKKPPICIIGAGPSGLTASRRLESKGYKDIVIFEKSSRPGGAVQSYTAPDGVNFQVTAVVTSNGSSPNLYKLLDEFQVPYGPASAVNYLYNIDTGIRIPPPTDNQADIAAALQAYLVLRQSYATYLVPGFIHGVPEELCVSIVDWLVAKNLTPLLPVAWYYTALGYGSAYELSAVQFLYYNDKGVIFNRLGLAPPIVGDYSELWVRLAANVKAQIHYNAEVVEVKRDRRGKKAAVIKYVRTDGKKRETREQHCSSVIAAFPTTPHTVKMFKLTKKEQSVFAGARSLNYWSSLVRLANAPSAVINNGLALLQLTSVAKNPLTLGPPSANYLPSIVTRLHAGSAYALAFHIIDDVNVPDDYFVKVNTRHLTLLNRADTDPVTSAQPLTAQDVIKVFKWDIYNHYPASQLRPSTYLDFEDIQGNMNTYWTSGLRTFPSQEQCVASAYDIIDRYF